MSRDDPMGRARAALDAARRARGAEEDDDAIEIPPVDPRNPMASAEAALARARQVQDAAKGKRITGRAADAALQLRHLKRRGFEGGGPPEHDPDPEPSDDPPQPAPRKRRL